MKLAEFRQQIFTTLHNAKSRWQDARVHLLYAPGTIDPLGLTQGDEPLQRNTALLHWGHDIGYARPQFPCIIELDCRRVAPYLLTTDPALDDPLLEQSISLLHGCLVATASEFSPEFAQERNTGRCLCGWLVSPDSAQTIANRFASASQRRNERQNYWLRWHDPRMLDLLWPQLSAEQKLALLGEKMSWLALDAAAHLVEFSSPPAGEIDAASTELNPSQAQWPAIHHLGLVNHLVDVWREQRSAPLPPKACSAVQREVARAQAFGLDGRDLQVFVLMALELHRGFMEDLGLQRAVQEAAREPGILADLIAELPPAFWQHYRPMPVEHILRQSQ